MSKSKLVRTMKKKIKLLSYLIMEGEITGLLNCYVKMKTMETIQLLMIFVKTLIKIQEKVGKNESN